MNDVGEVITGAMQHQACVDMRWRIWPEVTYGSRYRELIKDKPRWYCDLCTSAWMAVLVGWYPVNWSLPDWVKRERVAK